MANTARPAGSRGHQRSLRLWVAVLACCAASSAAAQPAYPNRPIRTIVAWAPGGAADLTARVASQKLSEQLGQQLVVDNRAGASGAIGAAMAAKAAPNGYTMLIGGVTELVLNPQIVKVPYDPLGDFSAVSPLSFGYYVLVLHPSLPARSVKELVALARKRPGEIKYASGGTGTNLSLVAELFKAHAGIDIAHIPYKGGGPAALAVMAGESQLIFSGIASVLQSVNAGRMRALALTGPKRSPLMPDVPTFAESGLSGLDVGMWFGLLAPKGTPPDIVTRLHTEVAKLGASADYRSQLDKLGFEPLSSEPDQFAAFLKTELERWGQVIKTAGVKSE
ncbi:MAG: tripartite tricarboxylate transporter substrate binding protein [Burkholderiales bacterium]|nr:tripartite tricarboxylate transporter substrate binding protein [Burkholderiales bacterium]